MKITIPDNFFPDPGEPFSTLEQRDIAVALHNLGSAKVQSRIGPGETWRDAQKLAGINSPNCYRLAPPEPVKIGPITVATQDVQVVPGGGIYYGILHSGTDFTKMLAQHPGKKFRIRHTHEAVEITE